MDTFVSLGSGDQPSVGFDLLADGRTVSANVLGNLSHFKPLLEPGLDR